MPDIDQKTEIIYWPFPENLTLDYSLGPNEFEFRQFQGMRYYRCDPHANRYIICSYDPGLNKTHVDHIAKCRADVGKFAKNAALDKMHWLYHMWNPRLDGIKWTGWNHYPYLTKEEQKEADAT
jgi:hypothetical protein